MIRHLGVRFLAVALLAAGAPAAGDHIPVLNEDAKLVASDAQAGDWFGHSVAIDGDTLGIGAVNVNEPDEDRPAYLFQRGEDGVWVEIAQLTYSDPGERRGFGQSVSLDGDTFVVGAYVDADLGVSAGAVYVFERSGGVWQEAAKLHASDGAIGDVFGGSLALEVDWLVVGAESRDDLGQSSGAAYVFQRDAGGAWTERAKLLASDGEADDRFGASVALSGSTIVVGAWGDDDRGELAGAVYIFEREDGSWVQTAKLLAPDGERADGFGGHVAIDGDILAVGATGDNDQALDAGSAYMFERAADGSWVAAAKLLSPHGGSLGNFGTVAISGETVVVGAFSDQGQPGLLSGTADVFRRSEEGTWDNVVRLLASDPGMQDQFGFAVAIDGDTVVVGARLDDLSRGAEDAGSAYVFGLEGCVLELRLDSPEVRAGEELRIGLYLEHNLPRTVTVPLQLWVEDEAGALIASRTTPPLTFRHGETLRREVTLAIPAGTPPGRYRVLAGVERMQQGLAAAGRSFTVVAPAAASPSD